MLFIFIWILNLIAVLIYKKNKWLGFFSILTSVLFIVYIPMDTVQDTIVYYSSYYNDNGGFEYGYTQVSHWFLIHGFSFLQFKFLVGFFVLALMGYCVQRYIQNLSLFVLLWLPFPFLIDVIQFRNFIMFSLVLYSSIYVTRNGILPKSYGMFILYLATLFHSGAWIFFAVIPLSFFKVSKIVKLVPFMIVFSWIFGFLLYFTSLSTKFINFLSQYTASITNREVLVDRVGGIYVPRFWQIFLFWIAITMFVLMVTKIVSLGIELQENLKILKPLLLFSIVGLLVIPLVTIQWDYTRIMRNSFVFAEIIYVWKIEHSEFHKKLEREQGFSFSSIIFIASYLLQAVIIYYPAEVEHIYRIINMR
ncbi:EpsG family protein [Leuconostoc mesenteroides]|uniref:EpsG family protein n=1 Tax=Leuconostoc mesenteroides TaxID=1245 RepID=UPI00236009A7|nr:EpsG family protein [Leuconostoc mesenteroides]